MSPRLREVGQYVDGAITGLGVAAMVFGIMSQRWWLAGASLALIVGYNALVWGRT